jgi:hypothetical protein
MKDYFPVRQPQIFNLLFKGFQWEEIWLGNIFIT